MFLDELDDLEDYEEDGAIVTGPACRVCGCSDGRACEGGCIWIDPELCSACYKAGYA